MQGTEALAFSIQALNRATGSQATAMMDRIVERSTWLADRAAAARPFSDAVELADWLESEVLGLSRDEAVQLLCAHPELSPREPSTMTAASQIEQGRLDILTLDAGPSAKLADLNRQYARRHGYPFIVALHEHDDFASVIAQFEHRLAADPDEELKRALSQVVSVMKARLMRLTGGGRVLSATGPANPSPVIQKGASR